MLFDPCVQFADQQFPSQSSLHSIIPDYDDLNVTKLCNYFEGLDFFDLAFDDVEHVDRLVTRSLKPRMSDAEVEEIIEMIQNLGIFALLKRNVEVYQACCNGFWRMGKKYIPLIMAKNKHDLSKNFHLRLKLWTSLFRICCYPCFEKAPCGVLDFKEKGFVDGMSAVHFGSLMNIAKLIEKAIPCSCVLTSWKTMIPSTVNSDFGDIFYRYFLLRGPYVVIDDAFFKTAYAFISSLSMDCGQLYITVFYALFPAFFQDRPKAARCLAFFHSKTAFFAPELFENLINCFSQNPTFISECEKVLHELTKRINDNKDKIITSYFPDQFSSLPVIIEDYCSPPKQGDDEFQLFIRLYVKSLNDSQIGAKFIEWFELFWRQSKVPKIYSFYLMLLAIAAKILGPQFILKQVEFLADVICPQECLFLRFFILQRTSDFQNTFNKFKSKIMVSSSNFSSFLKAFSLTVAVHPSHTSVMFTLLPKDFLRCLSISDASTFIEKIYRIPSIPSFIFEVFQRDLNLDTTFVANFFAFHLSASLVPPHEKVFTKKQLTLEFIEKLIEATVRQEKNLSKNALFGYQMALFYCFTKKGATTVEGKENFLKFIKLLLKPGIEILNDIESNDIGKVFDMVLSKEEELCVVFSKQNFEIIDENIKRNPECIPYACKQMCEILLSEAFVKFSHAFKGSANDSTFCFILDGFIKRYLIQTDLSNEELHLTLLKKLNEIKYPPQLYIKNERFINNFKKNLENKIEHLSF